jgi:ATP-dependent protease ClpP protease subunit
MPDSWEIKNKDNNIAEILIYGEIVGNSREWDEDSWSAKELNEELNNLGDIDELHIRINSGGGNAVEGISIYNSLKKYDEENDVFIKSIIEGLAASISSVIPLASSEIIMAKNSLYMIHMPYAMAMGTADDMRKRAEVLDSVTEIIINTYEDKTGLDREEIKEMMSEETWLESDRALKLNFIDKVENYGMSASVGNDALIMNNIEFDLDNFNNIPDNIKNIKNIKNKKKNKKRKDDNDMPFKAFETEEEFDEFKNSLKDETLKGYLKAEDVLDKFVEVDLEGDNLEDIVDKVKEVKNEADEANEELTQIKKDVAFNNRKEKLGKVGVEVVDEDKEEILNMSKKQFKMLVNSNKEKMEDKVDDDDDDGKDFMNFNLDDDDDNTDVANSILN